jgi:hypothetical protein
MGTVYRAERVKLGRAVAIKFLRPAFARQPDFVKRFEREALAMSRIYHHHCVSIIDFGMHEDSPYLVMEYVPGRSLSKILADGPVPARRAIRIVQQVLDTLGYFHRRNVLHRDLKAENIMIAGDEDEDDFVKVLDLGMAKLMAGVGADVSISAKGILVGTPSAMSPEQIREQPLDGRSDIYSVGVLLYYMLVGRRPFQSDDMIAVFKMHLEKPVPPPSEILGTRALSRELEAVVLQALAKDRNDRFKDTAAMSEALAATREARDHDRRPSTVGSMRIPAMTRPRPWIAYGGWALAALFAVLFVVQMATEPSAPRETPSATTPPPVTAVAPDASVAVAVAAPDAAADAAPAPATAWATELAAARALSAKGDHRGALRAISAITRASPDARIDPEVIAAAIDTLAAPTGDQFIPTLLRDLNGPALVEALAAAQTGGDHWYERHHAWLALRRAGHAERADDVAVWLADFERADTCKAAKKAYASLRGHRDPRATALVAALADAGDPRFPTQRACLR